MDFQNEENIKLFQLFKNELTNTSRQRLRAIHMSLRRYGSVELRISLKDLQHAFEGNRREIILVRLENFLLQREVYFDIAGVQEAFDNLDPDKSGKIQKDLVLQYCTEIKLPVYGALLKLLINFCSDGKNNCCWPDFIQILKRSQEQALKKNPALSQIQNNAKEKNVANPDVVDELSSSAKTKIVSQLIRKATIQREKTVIANQRKADLNEMTAKENEINSSDYPETEKMQFNVNGKLLTVNRPEGLSESVGFIDYPRESMQLEWVYGYRGNDCRNNIYVSDGKDIVYFISNIVVLYRRSSHTQRHYTEHTSEVKSIAIHNDGLLVASGQQCSKENKEIQAHIRIWRADNLQTLRVIGDGIFQKAVIIISFQENQDVLGTVDNGTEKRLSIWNTNGGFQIASVMIQVDVICDISFNAKYPEMVVTVGKEHHAWWKIDANTILPYSQANYEVGIFFHIHIQIPYQKYSYDNNLRAKFVICACHNENGDLITGDSNGTIYIWGNGGNKVTNFVKHGHDGPIFTLLMLKNNLFTGGRDGYLCCWEWSKNMDSMWQVEVTKTEGGIRMIQIFEDLLLIGTTMNSILMTNKVRNNLVENSPEMDTLPITQGHFDNVKGLCPILRSFLDADFLTAGTDGIICKFNASAHEPAWKLVMKGSTFLCSDCGTNGKLLCLGTQDGHLVIMEMNADNFSVNELLHRKISQDQLAAVALSPDEKYIAVGGGERAVIVYAYRDNANGVESWQCIGKCWGHKGSITGIDWSAEKINGSHYIRTSSSCFEQFFCVWCSQNSKETEITCLSLNSSMSLVAVGYSSGHIGLFQYPCTQKAYCHMYVIMKVHSLCFSSDGKYLIAVGGPDSCITQWKIVA
ncbi:hypothetical protein LOTGIDRAFT_234886 [Lottia gigantea]|uniref:EF-hand domain-containing protein n=1 Tax=Lottia gigantea TaxID=225164 RepID=V4A3V1_LOTGI|nr:hypothetical protein LOTGIDRAFT_234886 [Lottia gigantea]ESO87901.1 hypothetical protein LOTGIDRAFT_234886 [Lottia gigantea]